MIKLSFMYWLRIYIALMAIIGTLILQSIIIDSLIEYYGYFYVAVAVIVPMLLVISLKCFHYAISDIRKSSIKWSNIS